MCERWRQCVLLWTCGAKVKQETRQGAARLERGVTLVFATQGYYSGSETHCQFPELAADVCIISGVLTEIVSQKEQFFLWGRFNEIIEASRT